MKQKSEPLGMNISRHDTPLIWYPRLHKATAAERAVWEWHGDGIGITWPQLDEDLSIRGMLEGNPSVEYDRQLAKA